MASTNWSFLEDLFSKDSHYRVALSTKLPPKAVSAYGAESSIIVIEGFLVDQISFRFGAKYMELGMGIPTSLGAWLQAAESLARASPALEQMLSNIKVMDQGAVNLLTVFNTIKFWAGYEPFGLSLNLQIPILDRTSYERYKTAFRWLLNAVMPIPEDSSQQSLVISAPLGYKPPSADKVRTKHYHPEGTWSITIGKWFDASGFLINTVNFNFSRQVVSVDPEGIHSFPVMLEASIDMESWRILFADEVRSFFTILREDPTWGWP